MLGHCLTVQLKSNKITSTNKLNKNKGPLLRTTKPTSKEAKVTLVGPFSERPFPKQNYLNKPNVQPLLSSLNHYTPGNTKINSKKSSSLQINNKIINPANSKEQFKQGEYAKVFGLINSEIREITNLFKRTQSVDQQNKRDELNIKKPKDGLYNNEDIDYASFEKYLIKEKDKQEKVLEISSLEASETKYFNNGNSVLFSSYNSEFYRNLNINKQSYGSILGGSLVSSRNVVKIAKANMLKNRNSIKKSNENKSENKSKNKNLNKNQNVNQNEDQDDNDNDKTECQFQDVVFNQHLSTVVSEKTCNMMEEQENDHRHNQVPIQEVIKQIMNNKSQSINARRMGDNYS